MISYILTTISSSNKHYSKNNINIFHGEKNLKLSFKKNERLLRDDDPPLLME